MKNGKLSRSLSSRECDFNGRAIDTSIQCQNDFNEERANTSSNIDLHTSHCMTQKPHNSSSSRSPTSDEEESENKPQMKGFSDI